MAFFYVYESEDFEVSLTSEDAGILAGVKEVVLSRTMTKLTGALLLEHR